MPFIIVDKQLLSTGIAHTTAVGASVGIELLHGFDNLSVPEKQVITAHL